MQVPFTNHGHLEPHEGIVGTWLVSYPGIGQAFIQWHSDGTEWENITNDTIGGNICMGSWKSTGPWTYYRNHYGWLYDPVTGVNVGYFHATETDILSQDGNSYTGTNTYTFYNLSNVVTMGPINDTSSAMRIDP